MPDLLQLTEEQQAVLQTAREFAAQELVPNAARWDAEAYFEPSLIPKMGELGFLVMMLP